ncbi:MAG: hypothetical protein HYU66_02685 [Armatimonadetes bacterium]|nr:hypothetical protein [Armatimonadota bacterium]
MMLPLTLAGTLCAAPAGFMPRLLQVRLAHAAVPAGDSLTVEYWWRNDGDSADDGDQRVFVHLRRPGEPEAAAGAVRFGGDHDPVVPTHRWRPGRVIRYSAPIRVPPDTPPGECLLLLGLYDVASGERLSLDLPPAPGESDRRYLVARFRVVGRDQAADPEPVIVTLAPVPASVPPPPPARTVRIGRGPLEVVLDAAEPRVIAWRLAGHELSGDPLGDPPMIYVIGPDHRPHPAETRPYALAWSLHAERDRAVYHAVVSAAGQAALEFDLTLSADRDRAALTVDRIRESGSCQLLAVRASRLVAARDGARLALPVSAGRLVDPARAVDGERTFGMDWFTQMLAGVVHDRQLLATLEVPGVDNRVAAGVVVGWATLGAWLELRAATPPATPTLRLAERATVRLRFAAPQAPDWTAGARLLREEVKAVPPKLYDHTVIYKIFCDSPGAAQFTTFDQALDLVRHFGHLSDGAPQVAYLVGFQHHGHDTGYPDVFTVNERLGGLARLKAVMTEAEQLNAVVSFHDNYDDAYEQSPAWDPGIIARDPQGNLQKGGVWAGGQSYILAFHKYGFGPGLERVQRTLAMYPIRRTYHIDVLSAVPCRRSYSAAEPESGEASLAGKVSVVREFNRHGIDVTSEGFCAPFVGVIGHAWHLMRSRDEVFAGEERIPFVPFVYRGHATWGGASPAPQELPDALLYGCTFSADFTRFTPLRSITDAYYLLQVPFDLLRRREMTGYHAVGGVRRAEYGRDSYVEVTPDGGHRVVVDGRVVLSDGVCFAPRWDGKAWLAYARDGGEVNVAAPPGWRDGREVEVVALTPDGPGETRRIQVAGGRVAFAAEAGTPYRVGAR